MNKSGKLYAFNMLEDSIQPVEVGGKISLEKIRQTLEYVGSDDTDALDVYLIRLDDEHFERLNELARAARQEREEYGEPLERHHKLVDTFSSWLESGEIKLYGCAYSRRLMEGLAEALMDLLDELQTG